MDGTRANVNEVYRIEELTHETEFRGVTALILPPQRKQEFAGLSARSASLVLPWSGSILDVP